MKIPKKVVSYFDGFIRYSASNRCAGYAPGVAWDPEHYQISLWFGEKLKGRNDAIMWAVENGFFTITKIYCLYDNDEGKAILIKPTEKFYFDFVLPHIVKEKDRINSNWMFVLITDSVNRG